MAGKDTKLHEAVRYCDIDLVREALKDRLNPNEIGLYQWSALHEAAQQGELEILKLLLKHKGDPNKRDHLRNCTAVHYAAKEGHTECLKLIIKYGGRYDVLNSDGESPLDVAIGECEKLLQAQMVQDLIKSSKQVAKEQAKEQTNKHLEKRRNFQSNREKNDLDLNQDDLHPNHDDLDLDTANIPQIIEPQKECSGHRAWENKRGAKKSDSAFLKLSFEYNSHKSSLKIRVWEIGNILLPPPDNSMLSTIYIKSYLIPDKDKESKRKTEEVKVQGQVQGQGRTEEVKFDSKAAKEDDDCNSTPIQITQVVFQPATFKFSKPLEYSNLTKDTVKEKTVDIQVFVTQKYTRKSYIIAFTRIPLEKAVKKLVREKFPLTPCMGRGIPENMKVYSSAEFLPQHAYRNFSSDPNLRHPSMASLFVPRAERASSDTNLQQVHSEVPVHKTRSVEISVPPEGGDRAERGGDNVDDDDDDDEYLASVRVHKARDLEQTKSMVNLSIPIPGEISASEDTPDQIRVHSHKNPSSTYIRMTGLNGGKLERRKSVSTPELTTTDESEMSELDSSLNSQRGGLVTKISQQRRDVLSQLEKGKRRAKKDRVKVASRRVESPLVEETSFSTIAGVHQSPSTVVSLERRKTSSKSPDIARTASPQYDVAMETTTRVGSLSPPPPHTPNVYKYSGAQQTGGSDQTRLPVILTHRTHQRSSHRPHSVPGKAAVIDSAVHFEDDLTGQRSPERSGAGGRRESLQSYQPKPVRDYSPAKSPTRTRSRLFGGQGHQGQGQGRSESGSSRDSDTPRNSQERIEMQHLDRDEVRKQYLERAAKITMAATPEVRVQMFQRTGREPHPATPHHLRGRHQFPVSSQDDSLDPFYIPGTPVDSPAPEDGKR